MRCRASHFLAEVSLPIESHLGEALTMMRYFCLPSKFYKPFQHLYFSLFALWTVVVHHLVSWHQVLHSFGKVLSIITTGRLLPKVHVKVYTICVHLAKLHSSETWGPNASNLQHLHHYDCSMIHSICAIKSQNTTSLISKTWHWGYCGNLLQLMTQMVRTRMAQCATYYVKSG